MLDWGDGESDHQNCHHYQRAREYRVRIVGTAIHQLDVSKCHWVKLKLEQDAIAEIKCDIAFLQAKGWKSV